MKHLLFSLLSLVVISSNGQTTQNHQPPFQQPKLVVGIVVDQMRYEYLNRFWFRYGDGGFKRLINEGFNCKNHHFNYVPTYTAPGHTSVYTGTTPRVHGIIANNWYDKESKKSVYCAGDDRYKTVGSDSKEGQMSPHRMQVNTIGDALKLFTQQRSKVIGVALKDRGAILPAGHSANAAYWFEGGKKGVWITSSYYMDELPQWVNDFNNSRIVDQYKKDWNTLYDISTYINSREDENNFEGKFKNEKSNTFPHKLTQLWDDNKQYSTLKTSPFGNSITADFAMAAIEGEALGQHQDTDFIAISFSSTDYVGHTFGVNSKEIEDTYLRLDKDIERLLNFLDNKVGKGNYTLFLTADHGGSYVTHYLSSLKLPASIFDYKTFKKHLENFTEQTFHSKKLIENLSNNQIFLNAEEVAQTGKSVSEVENIIAQWILNYPKVKEVYTATQMREQNYTHDIPYLLQKGFNHKRSGNILIVLSNDVLDYGSVGSSHGSGFSYDTHIPLLFFGKGFSHGETYQRTEIPDIAPTITSLLGIPQTNGCTGNPVYQALNP